MLKIGYECMNGLHLAHYRIQWEAFVNGNLTLYSVKDRGIHDQTRN